MRGIANRVTALEALEDFLSRVPAYAAGRNYVREGYYEVSRLSPYVRRRLITEHEVVAAVLERYPFARAEKFIQEVVWRTYWKGWLERHPGIWTSCVEQEQGYRRESQVTPWGDRYRRACCGETELSFFNEWTHELLETGYLHNHVRMWFASIWIFTLKIPWQLGAMFMYRHLLDGDPASNTLSWRWVAGLQTKGKSYLARPDNIATYSGGRWRPKPGELAENTFEVQADDIGEGAVLALRNEPLPSDGYGVLTTSEDLSVECDEKLAAKAQCVAVLRHVSTLGEGPRVEQFISEAHEDALKRLGDRGQGVDSSVQILEKMRRMGLSTMVVVAPCVGSDLAPVKHIMAELEAGGVQCFPYRRSWDLELHRLADRGFFPFWERVKKLISRKASPLFQKVVGD